MEELSPEESLYVLLKILEEKVPLVFLKRKEFFDEDLTNQPAGRFANNNKIKKSQKYDEKQKQALQSYTQIQISPKIPEAEGKVGRSPSEVILSGEQPREESY